MLFLFLSSAFAKKVTVPIEIGVGPSLYNITGSVAEEEPLHYGVSFSAAAVITKKLVKENKKMIPKGYRKQALKMAPFRVSKMYIPDQIFFSPSSETKLYGASFAPYGLLLHRQKNLQLKVSVRLTLFNLQSQTLPSTFFARPGADLNPEYRIKIAQGYHLVVGWRSQLYPPQMLGAGALDELNVTNLGQSIWHIGQGYLELRYRFPYSLNV